LLNEEIEHQELYDLQKDSRENQNVAHKEKSLCKRFRLRLLEHTSRKKSVESMIREKAKISQKIKSLKKAGKI
jgi:hypothetical protein